MVFPFLKLVLLKVTGSFVEGTTYYTKNGNKYVEATGLTAFETGVDYYTRT